MDLHEDAAANTVTATFELPGVRKEDVQIEAHYGRLCASAESRISDKHAREGYARRERRFGRYARTLQLPQGVKEEEITAGMENGVLTLTFPRAAPEAVLKRISIA
ncbi:HSP20-like chaperone [Mycena sp. CBHHK59/15]|nr:HSP20-like chaperone [Mycena sp. CBHHK59/15]